MNVAEAGSAAAVRARLFLLSILIGIAAAYVCFVAFLQTAAVSLLRLGLAGAVFLAVSAAHYLLAVRFLRVAPRLATAIRSALVLTAIFLPLLYAAPAFPLSPLLRPWADLAVQFEVPSSSGPLLLQPDTVKLVLGKDVLNANAFNLVGSWTKTPAGLQLAPGATGSLQWTGTVPDTITLALQPPPADSTLTVYWNNIRTSAQLHGGSPSPLLIVEKSSLPWGYNLVLFLSFFILIAWLLGLLGLIFGNRLASLRQISTSRGFPWVMLVLSLVLAAVTVKLQIDSLSGGMQYLATTQLVRHANVLQGQAPDPWQYRVFSEWLAELLLRVSSALSILNPVDFAFISLRLAQNVAIFLIAFALYKKVSRSSLLALVGVLALAGSMKNAYYDNDLAFNTYFDVLFYLLAGLLLLSRRYYAVVILTLFAALNRETSGIIPFMMVAAIVEENHHPGVRKFLPALLAAGLFAGVFIGLRLIFPARPIYIPYKHPPGVPLLLYNITRQFTWDQLWLTLGSIPALGLVFVSSWPRLWQRFLLILCPIWFAVHSFASVMAETRLFLVPQALVFIPGVLFVLNSFANSRDLP